MKRWDVVIDLVGSGATGAEVGVWRGLMSRYLLKAGIKLYMVDRWTAYSPEEIAADEGRVMTHYPQPVYDEALKLCKAIARKYGGTIVHAESAEAAKQVPDGLDFVFIDAAHDYESVRRDIKIWQPKIRSGGLLMGHDYVLGNQVAKAVDEAFPVNGVFDDKVWAVWI